MYSIDILFLSFLFHFHCSNNNLWNIIDVRDICLDLHRCSWKPTGRVENTVGREAQAKSGISLIHSGTRTAVNSKGKRNEKVWTFLGDLNRICFLLVKQVKSPSSTCKKISFKLPGETINYGICFLFLLSTFSSQCLGRGVVSKGLYHSPHYLNTFYWSSILWAKDYFQSDVNEHQEMGWCKKWRHNILNKGMNMGILLFLPLFVSDWFIVFTYLNAQTSKLTASGNPPGLGITELENSPSMQETFELNLLCLHLFH